MKVGEIKGMMYVSTRGRKGQVSSAKAILDGIAADGGLFVPTVLPQIDRDFLAALPALDYRQRALRILRLFLTDYTEEELSECLEAAYNTRKFDCAAIAPLQQVGDTFVLELWHGPTSAFKDMALQLLPQTLSLALQKTQEQADIVILVATSGDTGKAALEGFKDVDRTKIIVFYPYQGVSEIQRLQMVSQEGENVAVVAVHGNFDDAQTGVKQLFGDPAFGRKLHGAGLQFSSANSINWGRLAPQIVYYFSAYADLVAQGTITVGQPVNFAVPTGNFGNILAGYYAQQMGLPIRRLLCASNCNHILADFLQTGVYDRNRQFYKTLSPSMDILVSSNLERLLYHVTEGNASQISSWMADLNTNGRYELPEQTMEKIHELFWPGWIDDDCTTQTIRRVYRERQYVMDPHTAVAWQVYQQYRQQTGDATPCIVVSTASPFKFNASVLAAVKEPQGTVASGEFAMLRELSERTGYPVPSALSELADKPVLHTKVCEKENMAAVVADLLGI